MQKKTKRILMASSSNRGCGTYTDHSFQASQIVGLAHDTGCLYAEVVQIIESRQSCWVRPLVLALWSMPDDPDYDRQSEEVEYHDLRQDSDLLLPLTLFQAALDVEVLPWLTELYTGNRTTDNHSTVMHSNDEAQRHRHFREFIQRVWQAHPEVFQAASHVNQV